MVSLTFGEQVKILLSRNNLTIKELAEMIEERTGTKMSRQNLTQRLGRDNFQEQDMRTIAEILGCSFYLSILGTDEKFDNSDTVKTIEPIKEQMIEETKKDKYRLNDKREITMEQLSDTEREVTIGELAELFGETLPEIDNRDNEGNNAAGKSEEKAEAVSGPHPEAKQSVERKPIQNFKRYTQKGREGSKDTSKSKDGDTETKQVLGEVNPYTGREYESNSVRMHSKRIGYVQVYDKGEHKWTDMTEWAFLGYQERKKALLGKGYDPPIYLD